MPAPGGHGGHGGPGFGFMMSHPPIRPGNTTGRGNDAPPKKTEPKKEHDFLPSLRAKKITYTLATLALIMSTFTVFANILGSKVWPLGFFLLDGGIIVFPIVWTAQDIMVQVFYKKTTNVFCGIVAVVNLIAVLALFFCTCLPNAPDITNPNFSTIFEFSARVFVASSAGYFIRSLINNGIFDAMRTTTDDRRDIPLRAIVSSLCGRVFDSVIFTTIAFLGRADFLSFVQQAITSFIAATIIEFILSFLVTKPVSLWLTDYLKQP